MREQNKEKGTLVWSLFSGGMIDGMQEGVAVQGIFEGRNSTSAYSQLSGLYCAGAEVRKDGNPNQFHHKVIVIDGQYVVTGSFNFSRNADESNDENVIILDDPAGSPGLFKGI